MDDRLKTQFRYGEAPDYVYGAANGRTTEENVKLAVDKYSMTDCHIGLDEKDSPWIPILEGVKIKHLAFDVRRGAFSNIVWVQNGGGIIGRHRHRGTVDGFCMEGSWKYLEYDWVATAGSYVHETPGAIHTLYSENGMKTYFSMVGPLEFFDDDDNVIGVHDVFFHINGYMTYCRENNIPINELLFQ
jgi:2,4'-dihydroxyacetophenone dioxygenase